MKRVLPLVLAAALALTGPAAAQESVRIEFEPGATSATINGTIVGGEYIDYVLGARAGQTMVVSLAVTGTNGNGSAFFNIVPAGQDFPALFNGSNEGRRAEVTLPESQDWAIRVYLMGNDADTGKTVGYSIDVLIAPGGGATGGSSGGAGLLPEEDFFVVDLSTSGGQLNVRDAPSASGALLGTIPNGTSVSNRGGCTVSDGDQWCNVQAEGGGITGWVAARFLRLPGPPGEDTATADDGGGAMAGASGEAVRVQFAPGTSGAELSGQLLPQQSRRYIVGASNGQDLYFRLAANGPGMTYVIANPDGSILLDEMSASQEYRGQLWQTGDHSVTVYNTSNGAQSYAVIFGIE